EKALEYAKKTISQFAIVYRQHFFNGMRAKLGIFNEEAEDELLIEHLLRLMKKYRADYTNTFLALTFEREEDFVLAGKDEFLQWKKDWKERLKRQDETKESAKDLMKKNNPAVIPRNHLVEEALEAIVERSDDSVMEKLLEVLENPYDH